ncbi:MAG: DUF1501 domain-containing protein [Planctomycetes bacterium]|nr:DUF1501 domain-containing protein [Planctomycetota bacterium]
MLNLPGITRRDLLKAGAMGALSLGTRFQLQEARPAAASSSRLPGFGRARSCILLFLFGSPSQHDTFDPKPNAPDNVRGEFRPIATSVPGTQICELFPRTARICDQATIVRSMTHPYPIHGIAYAVTSTPTLDIPMQLNPRDSRNWPFIGSVVEHVDQRRGTTRGEGVPNNIALPWLTSSRRNHPSRDAGPYGHFLGTAADPIWTEFQGEGNDTLYYDPSSPNPNLDPYGGLKPGFRFPLGVGEGLSAEVGLARLDDRRRLLRHLDSASRTIDRQDAMGAFDHHRRRAFAVLTSNETRQALDVEREAAAVRERYGMTLFGQASLAARRLVEAGSRFVTVFWDDFHHLQSAWDTHSYHYPKMRNLLCPGLDQTFTALIDDLRTRGLLDETLVVCMSEHGRTPRLVANRPGGGRDHWSSVYSMILAGGGIARGRVVGRSDSQGGEVAATPVSPKDVLATMYHLLGIDPHTILIDRLGRPVPAAGEGQVRAELLG